MSNRSVFNQFFSNPRYSSYLVLLLVYFLCRLFFQQLTSMKIGFIYPTGILVNLFYGIGEYINGEWLFNFVQTQFVLNESCSGTTFFSLLVAYIAFRMKTKSISFVWLVLVYPITLLANAMRVMSSIYAHNTTAFLNMSSIDTYVHVITGTIAFLCSFLCIAYLIEKPSNKNAF